MNSSLVESTLLAAIQRYLLDKNINLLNGILYLAEIRIHIHAFQECVKTGGMIRGKAIGRGTFAQKHAEYHDTGKISRELEEMTCSLTRNIITQGINKISSSIYNIVFGTLYEFSHYTGQQYLNDPLLSIDIIVNMKKTRYIEVTVVFPIVFDMNEKVIILYDKNLFHNTLQSILHGFVKHYSALSSVPSTDMRVSYANSTYIGRKNMYFSLLLRTVFSQYDTGIQIVSEYMPHNELFIELLAMDRKKEIYMHELLKHGIKPYIELFNELTKTTTIFSQRIFNMIFSNT